MVAASWPKGPVPWLLVFGMATGVAGAFFPVTRSWPVIKQTFQLGITLFRSLFGYQVVMGSAIVAHIVEAAIIAYMCAKNKVSTKDTWGWAGYTLLIGYGAIHHLKACLKQAA
ncbi:hypothetical protein CHLRE_02g114800v5 [Chlamydomonas reinhardtii]|uniref:Uncharacterized protein n=1 Tax=Chlamydomonas reinhardtii TaxID=3055 RepID=A8I2U5_CHLRE|nr:uncharacterized protein CHLRE_02g114800v5 [Chlamydomonas reinhardtii]PNW87244.1 hypothetical protein CHLRE_02g114800v5 [Chlamydomonas reinhardtii]|eukprot:XP_001699658.1 predicted protein [Chlamydomonas reinhardtii]